VGRETLPTVAILLTYSNDDRRSNVVHGDSVVRGNDAHGGNVVRVRSKYRSLGDKYRPLEGNIQRGEGDGSQAGCFALAE
jgi:hypothetical protein